MPDQARMNWNDDVDLNLTYFQFDLFEQPKVKGEATERMISHVAVHIFALFVLSQLQLHIHFIQYVSAMHSFCVLLSSAFFFFLP